MQKGLLIMMLIFCIVKPGLKCQPADFSGYRIFINPGHGGYDSDDRHMLTTDFWESEGNLVKGLYLREILQKMKATVYMSRTTNTTADDLPLSSISAMANAASVDFFLAIHSNGYDGTQNKPLMLFRGYDNQPVFPEAKVMGSIMWNKLFENGNCWTGTSEWVKGDWTFYPDWGTQGLGVLRNLSMPGVLSEGSFHDYVPESWRLRNIDFLHHESMALARSFIEHKNVTPPAHGVIAGVIRDPARSPSWFYKPGTPDKSPPLNGAKVILKPGNRTYFCDTLNNGFFMFDSVAPGPYRIIAGGVKEYMTDSVDVTVIANKSARADIYLNYDTTLAPVIEKITPAITDSVAFNQEFVFFFTMSMDRDSVQKALKFLPAVQLTYSWNDEGTVLKVKPAVRYLPKTNYTVTLSVAGCSEWNVHLTTPSMFSFITKNRTYLRIEKCYPSAGQLQVSLYPQVKLIFDAPLDPATITSNITLLNETGQILSTLRAQHSETGGKGIYTFELQEALQLNKGYKIVVYPDLADVAGVKTGRRTEVTFTTRTTAYPSAAVVENFDDIGRFWDPETSGSTVGTDNPLTTFTSSSEIKRGGVASGRLDYVFVNQSGGLCRVFDTQKPVIGYDASKLFGMWVFGDLSNNVLEYWFYSSGTTNQIVVVDTIDWAGWELKTIPFSMIGGSGDRNYHSIVIRQKADGSTSGSMWFDEAQLITPTGIFNGQISSRQIDYSVYPNPADDLVTVAFQLEEAAEVRLDICTMAGKVIKSLADERLIPGRHHYTWELSGNYSRGTYLCRLELRYGGGKAPEIFARKIVIVH